MPRTVVVVGMVGRLDDACISRPLSRKLINNFHIFMVQGVRVLDMHCCQRDQGMPCRRLVIDGQELFTKLSHVEGSAVAQSFDLVSKEVSTHCRTFVFTREGMCEFFPCGVHVFVSNHEIVNKRFSIVSQVEGSQGNLFLFLSTFYLSILTNRPIFTSYSI